jgi:hydrogenase-4 component B
MQYTASSFAQPLVDLFGLLLRTRRTETLPQGHFPARGSLSTETPDAFVAGLYRPVFSATAWLVLRLRWIQHGRLQLYVLYIAVTLLILLFWKLG